MSVPLSRFPPFVTIEVTAGVSAGVSPDGGWGAARVVGTDGGHIAGTLEASHSAGTRRVYASDWRRFRAWCARSLYPTDVQPAIVCDNYSPHLTARKCCRVADWAEANNVEIAYDGTDHASHHGQSRL